LYLEVRGMKAVLVCQGGRMDSVVAVVMVEDDQYEAAVAELRASDPEAEWFTTRALTVETVAQVVQYFADEKQHVADDALSAAEVQ
jgi:hypothetical protein